MAMTTSTVVLAVELDSGPLFLGITSTTYGVDVVHGAILNEPNITSDGASLEIIADALPPECEGAWWAGRDSALIRVDSDAGSVYDGQILFDGEIAIQPAQSGNMLNITLVQSSTRVVELPKAAPVDTITYPLAAPEAVGLVPPTIFGTVENCDLLAVEQQIATTLAVGTSPSESTLTLADITGFPAYGAVWVGDETIIYNGISGDQLVGLTVKQSHPKDTPVVLAGLARYLPAEHAVGVVDVYAENKSLSGWFVDADNTIRFAKRPLVEAVGQAMNTLVQFDQVATGSWDVDYDISYEAGRTIKADHLTRTLVTTTEVTEIPPPPAKSKSGTLSVTGTITSVTKTFQATHAWASPSGRETATWAVVVSASGSISTPSGAAVTVTSSVDYPGVTVGGKQLTNGKISLSGGTISVSGSYTLYVTYGYAQFQSISNSVNIDGVISTVDNILKAGRTLDECASLARQAGAFTVTSGVRSNYPLGQISNFSFPQLSVSWKETTTGTPLTVETPVTKEEISRESESVPTLADLHQIITAPQSIVAGNFTFDVEVIGQARQDIDNPAPVYTASLGGVSFSLPKAGGTVSVVVPVTAGQNIELEHIVNHAGTDMSDVLLTMFEGGLENMADYDVTSAIALICPQIRTVSVTWSNATISNAALNPVNAIRAITGTVSQSATGLDTSISTEGSGYIRFARPSADRIVSGTYTVSYSVALNGFSGPMGIKIGNEWVYYADGEVPTYAWNPATIQFDDDTDLLPVEVSGGDGIVVVTITAASRVVLTGNLDGGKYATLKHPSNINWKAVQADVVPRLGTLNKARLAIEWFMGGNKGAANPNVQVKFGDVVRGSLRLEAPAGATTSRTITVDVTSQGNATLTSSNINTVVSGGTASLSHSSVPQNTDLSPALSAVNIGATAGVYVVRGWSLAPKLLGWSYPTYGPVTLKLTSTYATPISGVDYCKATIKDASGTTLATLICASGTPGTNIATDTYQNSTTITGTPARVEWEMFCFSSAPTKNSPSPSSLSFEWSGALTNGAITQSNTPASGYTSIPTPTLNHSGTAVAVNNGSFTITVPDTPRTIITEFELPDVTDWADLTGKVCEINYLSGVSTLDIHLVQVQLAVDYTEESLKVVGGDIPLQATLVGLSDNPANVIQYLGEIQGENFSVEHLARLREWCYTNNYLFARRIPTPTDALTLMTYAAEQSTVHIATLWNGRLAPIRWFDLSTEVTDIHENDLLSVPTIDWTPRVENNIILNYREGENGAERSLLANSSNNVYCRYGVRSMRRESKVTLDAFWIRDDATAEMYLDSYVRRYARPRRRMTLALPFSLLETIEDGDLIRFYPYNTPEDKGIFARVVRASCDAGWPVIEAEEILV